MSGIDDRGRTTIDGIARTRPGLLREILGLLCHTKKWWLAPVILAMLVLALLVFLMSTGAAPFLYPLF